jgi:hypothetical protein
MHCGLNTIFLAWVGDVLCTQKQTGYQTTIRSRRDLRLHLTAEGFVVDQKTG